MRLVFVGGIIRFAVSDTSQQLPRTLWVGVFLLLIVLCLAYALSLLEFKHAHPRNLPSLGQVAPFSLTNQDNQVTTLADLSNRVWVADIIFTRCAASCPVMTRQMASLQQALPPSSKVALVTLTTDPDFDTPEVLKRYGERAGAKTGRWIFLTGTRVDIATLAANSLKLSAQPVKPEDRQNDADLFVHSTSFVVVDKDARLRAIFQTGGDGIDWTNVQPQLIATVRQLERER